MIPFIVIIPARYQSTRLPGKPLREIAGRPMIAHVIDRARESGASRIIVATDHAGIAQVVEGLGARVCMTRDDHFSGTDRLAEVVDIAGLSGTDIVVNLQGDEPLMPAPLLDQVAGLLHEKPQASIATLSSPMTEAAMMDDPNIVKVVATHHGRALYFSRAPIPWDRSQSNSNALQAAQRHLGLYAYRADFLKRVAMLPPSPLEQLEQLEQLRALQAGEWIEVAEAIRPPAQGVDTLEDLQRVEATFQ